MPTMRIPVRYYRDFAPHYDHAFETLSLKREETALLLVDVDGGAPNPVTEQNIAPALAAARAIGLRVAYVHNDLRLVADPGNIVFEIWGKTKGMRTDAWRPSSMPKHWEPDYLDCVAPLPGEPNFPKWVWSGFRDTTLDQHLRSWGIRNLVSVGYSLRACFYGTMIDAVYNNYRVIVLRDCTRAPELPDTQDASLEEGGWINRIFLRNIEHLVGYTSTSAEFAAACRETGTGGETRGVDA